VTAPVVCWPGFPARRTGRTPRSAVALRSGQAARQFHGTASDEMRSSARRSGGGNSLASPDGW
jgi:hypothetical protein